MKTMSRFVYLIEHLDDKFRAETITDSKITTKISQPYRNLILDFANREFIPELVQLVLKSICGDTVTREEFRDFTLEVLPDGVWWKMFYKRLLGMCQFLIDHIQISKEDAKLMIELRIVKVSFFGDYIEITTGLNEEVLEHGLD